MGVVGAEGEYSGAPASSSASTSLQAIAQRGYGAGTMEGGTPTSAPGFGVGGVHPTLPPTTATAQGPAAVVPEMQTIGNNLAREAQEGATAGIMTGTPPRPTLPSAPGLTNLGGAAGPTRGGPPLPGYYPGFYGAPAGMTAGAGGASMPWWQFGPGGGGGPGMGHIIPTKHQGLPMGNLTGQSGLGGGGWMQLPTPHGPVLSWVPQQAAMAHPYAAWSGQPWGAHWPHPAPPSVMGGGVMGGAGTVNPMGPPAQVADAGASGGASMSAEATATVRTRWAGVGEGRTMQRRERVGEAVSRGRLGTYNDWQLLPVAESAATRANQGRRLLLPGLQQRLDTVWEPRAYNDGHLRQMELKLPKTFSGLARDGQPTLRAFWHDVRTLLVTWEQNNWDLRQFFLLLGPLLTGPAKDAYMQLQGPIMDLPEKDAWGRPLLTEEGQKVPVQDPTAYFFAELERRFPIRTQEVELEFANFRRKEGESPQVCAARMRELMEIIGMPECQSVVGHFLSAWPHWVRTQAAYFLGPACGRFVTLEDAGIIIEALMDDGGNLQRSIFRPMYQGRNREDRRETGTGGRNEETLMAGFRAETGEGPGLRRGQKCYNCEAPGHLARDCPEPPRDSWAERVGTNRPEGIGGEGESERSTAELVAQVRRIRAELQRRRTNTGGVARMAQAEGGAGREALGEEFEEEVPLSWLEEEYPTEGLPEGGPPAMASVAWDRQGQRKEEEESPAAACLAEPREKGELGLRNQATQQHVKELGKETAETRAKWEEHLTVTHDPLPEGMNLQERLEQDVSIVRLPNEQGLFRVAGVSPNLVVVDTGANRMLLGRRLRQALGEKANEGEDVRARIGTAEGSMEVKATAELLETTLLAGTPYEVRLRLRYYLTDSDAYDVLVGTQVWYRLRARICCWRSTLSIRPYFWCRERCGLLVEIPVEIVWKGAQLRDIGLLSKSTAEPNVLIMRGNRSWRCPEGGIVLVDLFSGIGTAVLAAVQAGMKVKKWVMVEPNQMRRRMAKHMAYTIRKEYPECLSEQVIAEADRWGPQDIRLWSSELIEAIGEIHLLVAGWECQGHSRAGKAEGLSDPRSSLFWELVRFLQALQWSAPAAAIVVENVVGGETKTRAQQRDWQLIQEQLGKPAILDAVQFGSYAHRVRAFWNNQVAGTELEVLAEPGGGLQEGS